jgi:hypothetical protein
MSRGKNGPSSTYGGWQKRAPMTSSDTCPACESPSTGTIHASIAPSPDDLVTP